MEDRTKEMPLVQPKQGQTAPLRLIAPEQEAPNMPATRPLALVQSPTPPPFPAPAAAPLVAPVAPSTPPPPLQFVPRDGAPPVPPPFPAQAMPVQASAPTAVPPRSAPRRWPVALASWVGGMVAGMLLVVALLGAFGGPRALPAASTGDPTAAWDTSITLTDAYLTAQARKGGSGQVQEPTLRVQADGTIAMTGKVALFGRSVPMTATLQPSLHDGALKMDLVNVQVGGLPLPQALTEQLAGSAMGATQPPASAMPTTLVKIEASAGKLVIFSKIK